MRHIYTKLFALGLCSLSLLSLTSCGFSDIHSGQKIDITAENITKYVKIKPKFKSKTKNGSIVGFECEVKASGYGNFLYVNLGFSYKYTFSYMNSSGTYFQDTVNGQVLLNKKAEGSNKQTIDMTAEAYKDAAFTITFATGYIAKK